MPNWTGVITNAGSLLLSEWVNEKILTITSAQAGTGTVPTVALMGQTALVNPKQAAVIAGGGEIEGGKRVNLQVTAAETAYTLNQFGLYAKVDDGSPVLLAIYQNEEGVPIPALSDTPDFLYTFMAAISVSNQGAWEVTISASASLTWDLVGVPNGIAGLDENGKVPASQLPEMDYIPSGEKGKKNGVATLGADGKLSDGQVPDASKVPYESEKLPSAANVKQALDSLKAGLDSGTVTARKVTAAAAGWSGELPTQSLAVEGVAADTLCWVGLDSSATPQQRDAARKAVICPTGQGPGTITLACDGVRPAVDLPILIYVSGGVN